MIAVARMTLPASPTPCSASSTRFPTARASTCGRTPRGTCSTSARPSGSGAGCGAISRPISPTARRTSLLQRLIADVETIVVPSEAQSLILENNLIKEYRPRFNVRLKDDKSYPVHRGDARGSRFPRVLVTRRRDIPGARYFGPYTDVGQLRRTLAHHPPALHGAQLPRRSPARAPRAPLPRLPHRPLPGALRRVAGPGGLPPDDRRRARLPRGPDRRRADQGARGDAGRQRPARTTSGPGTCGTRSAGWSSWRSRSASRSSAPATRTSSATRATATTPSAC